jgi:hypothetical protein
MPLNRTWPLFGALLCALLCAAASCTSRTLPLPPPVVDDVFAPNAQGLVRVTGHAHENASVGVLNDSTMTGVIVTSPDVDCARVCTWEALVPARAGDQLRIWQFFETSGFVESTVPEP